MEDNDVIDMSSSPWASSIILVKKKDGSTSFVCTIVDFKSGYWPVEVYPDDKEKTASIAGQGLWQFKVMPFGLCNAPAIFKHLMETVLGGLSYECTNRPGLDLGCERLQLPDECSPVSEFLGYYRKFVKKLSTIHRPLHKLTKAKQKFIWTGNRNNAFNKFTDVLSVPVLEYPEIGKQFILDTDASHESIRAMLSQEKDGHEYVIVYFKGQIATWIQRLQEYDREICHRKGSAHGKAEPFREDPVPRVANTAQESKRNLAQPPDTPLAPEEYVEILQTQMGEMHHLARDRIGMASEKMRTRYNRTQLPRRQGRFEVAPGNFDSISMSAGLRMNEFERMVNCKIFQSGNSAQNTAVRNANDQLLQSRFISGLRNDIRRFVLSRDPLNLDESINAALIEEQNMKLNQIASEERSGLSSAQTENPVLSALADRLEEMNLRVGRLQEASSVTARKSGGNSFNRRKNVFKCFYCGIQEHRQADCRKKQRDERAARYQPPGETRLAIILFQVTPV
ncbi:transposon Ty3-G Gag-Pol polyprotein [Trichonephila clavipes]|nr:transposon Ty3-G Gag-Pol polyprotein [Trichonephila clavipes]